MYSSTQGSSIGYKINGDKKWKLYSQLLKFEEKGKFEIQAKAIRIGYKESKISTITIVVE